jgi:molybdopterin-binding protein
VDLQEEDSKQSDCGKASSRPAERSGRIALQNPGARPEQQRKEEIRRVNGRNQLVERIESAQIRGWMARVSIGGQQITSIIMTPSAREMQLQRGQTAAALIKATGVMILRV